MSYDMGTNLDDQLRVASALHLSSESDFIFGGYI